MPTLHTIQRVLRERVRPKESLCIRAQVAEEEIEAWQISGAMTNIIFRCQNLRTCQVSISTMLSL